MRLIDADAYLYKGDLINEPTIDAEPVRHGHWIKEKYEKPICSVCGNEGFLIIVDSITNEIRFAENRLLRRRRRWKSGKSVKF